MQGKENATFGLLIKWNFFSNICFLDYIWSNLNALDAIHLWYLLCTVEYPFICMLGSWRIGRWADRYPINLRRMAEKPNHLKNRAEDGP